MSLLVRPYIPPPLCCYRRQRYGHIAVVCKGKQRCPNCGGDHRIENCGESAQDKSCKCVGQYRGMWYTVRKRDVEGEQGKAVNNISYAEVMKRVQEQRRNEDTDTAKHILRQGAGQAEQTSTTLMVGKQILSIAYVINCTDQVKHKTKKMKNDWKRSC